MTARGAIMGIRRVVHFAIGLLVCGVCAAGAAPDDAEKWKVTEERWYIMEIGGAKVGWTSNITETDGSRIRTTEHSSIKVERGESAVKISTESTFIETADNKPASMEYTQDTAAQTVHTLWKFDGAEVTQVVNQGGRETTKKVA